MLFSTMARASSTVAFSCTMARSTHELDAVGMLEHVAPMEMPAPPALMASCTIWSTSRVESMRSPPAMTTGTQQEETTSEKLSMSPV